jgi:hypothetical protein
VDPHNPKPGDRFRAAHILDPGWKPGPDQKYADAPKAVMAVTRVTAHTVWYGYADAGKAGWRADRNRFTEVIGDAL